MYLDEGDVEFEVNLGRCKTERATGILEGGFHSGRRFVLFAFEEPDAAKTGEDLGVGGAIFVEGHIVLYAKEGYVSNAGASGESMHLHSQWTVCIASARRRRARD